MIVTLKSKVPLEIDPNEIIELCGIENGMSDVVIRQKTYQYLVCSLNPPEDMDTNIQDVANIIADIVMDSLMYYVVINTEDENEKD